MDKETALQLLDGYNESLNILADQLDRSSWFHTFQHYQFRAEINKKKDS